MLKFIFLFLFLFSKSLFCSGQSIDSLSILINDIQKGTNDSIRFHSNEKFLNGFEKILQQPGSFDESFEELKNVSHLTSSDNSFRMYTWVVPHFDGSDYDYFGFIQLRIDTTYKLFRLDDSTDIIQKPESEKLRNECWLGAIYYNMIPVKKSGKTYYTLLGWKAKDKSQTQKIIEVIYFEGNKIKFGYPLFKTGSVFRNRMIFKFNSQTSMTLRYDEDYNGIVFDHLSVDKNNPTVLAGPDGTYDAFKLKKGKWVLYKDVDVGTKWKPNENLPVPPE